MDDIRVHEQELEDNLSRIIKSGIFLGSPVILFGANSSSDRMERMLHKAGIPVYCVVDNGEILEGKSLRDVPVMKPQNVPRNILLDAYILIASKWFQSMKQQLLGLGVSSEKIIEVVQWIRSYTSMEDFEAATAALIEGEKVYDELQKEHNDIEIIVCPYQGLGDVYFVASYLNSYAKKKRFSQYVLTVIGNVCGRVADMFDLQAVKVLTQKESDKLVKFVTFQGMEKSRVVVLSHNMLAWSCLVYFCWASRLDWGTMFRKIILQVTDKDKELPKSGEREKKDAEYFCIEHEVKEHQSVILSPYANTIVGISQNMWIELAKGLKEKGYRVYTNSCGETEPAIVGTESLEFPLEIARYVVEYAGFFVGIRSGFCDIVEGADAKMVVLYPQKRDLFFRMHSMGLGMAAKEYLCGGNDVENIYRLLIE